MTAEELFGPETDEEQNDEPHPLDKLFAVNMETPLDHLVERFRAMGLKV